MTTEQIRNRTKTVTRRKGWRQLQCGTILNACRKCMGLRPGETIEKLATIRVVDVQREPLDLMMSPGYGDGECRMEGFPKMKGPEFVEMFVKHMGGTSDQEVTRIEFEYVD